MHYKDTNLAGSNPSIEAYILFASSIHGN